MAFTHNSELLPEALQEAIGAVEEAAADLREEIACHDYRTSERPLEYALDEIVQDLVYGDHD